MLKLFGNLEHKSSPRRRYLRGASTCSPADEISFLAPNVAARGTRVEGRKANPPEWRENYTNSTLECFSGALHRVSGQEARSASASRI